MRSKIRTAARDCNVNQRANISPTVVILALLLASAPLRAQESAPVRLTKDQPAGARICVEVEGRADICWTAGQLRAADPLRLRAEALRAKAAAAQAEARLTDAGLNAEMQALQSDVAKVFGDGFAWDFGAMTPKAPEPPKTPELEGPPRPGA